ncbi:hypothetical protein NXW50_30940 [Bacteroides thetaiotaomicron]|nr:hypothetical protein [Bacteroides thetaiotaomicron]MCS2282384.1 hypothetical protein [Bacteroides thetaiotaomicron]
MRWAAYSHSREDGEIRIFQKDEPDQQAAFALRCGRELHPPAAQG